MENVRNKFTKTELSPTSTKNFKQRNVGGLNMKIFKIITVVAWLTVGALCQGDCPQHCVCSEGKTSIAQCTTLNLEQDFPERVKHLVVLSAKELNLTSNFFSSIGLEGILSIKISNSTITNIHINAFEGLQQLTDVNLSDNGLILINPDTFHNNTRLTRLKLSGNPLQLTQILKAGEDYFLKSQSLLELDLSRCQLSNINKKLLAQLPNLQWISLKGNSIKVINEYIFENSPLLDEIDLSNNLLLSINEGIFEDIDELTTLNLHNNMIENIEDFDLPGLKELDISFNNIKLLTKTTFEGISDVSSLNISNNGISWISEEAFKDLVELRHLDLSHNAVIGPLPKYIFEENEYLETLSLRGNKDMNIFEGFSTELPRLYLLDISDCGLSNITNSSFSGMPSLAILNISANALTTLSHVMMSKLHRLNVLDASYNQITKVGTYTFASNSHLRQLNLSNNKIHHLAPNTFETTPSLSNLDISYNQFTHIWHSNDSDYMKENKFLDKLEYFNIAGNRIEVLHKNHFSHLTSLKAINIMDNPLECTQDFPVFIEWLYKSHIDPLLHSGKTDQEEKQLEISNLQWDELLMDICKMHNDKTDIESKPEKVEENINIYRYTVIGDVNLLESKGKSAEVVDSEAEDKETLEEEINNYVWPTFLIVFSIVFLTLAIGNTIALLIYRSRNNYNTAGLRNAFVAPFKRSVVKIDTTPRYHKLYEECSVPNKPIVKSNLLGNLVSSQIKCDSPKPKNDEVV